MRTKELSGSICPDVNSRPFYSSSLRLASKLQNEASCRTTSSSAGWRPLEELPRNCWRTAKFWSSSCRRWRPTCRLWRTTGWSVSAEVPCLIQTHFGWFYWTDSLSVGVWNQTLHFSPVTSHVSMERRTFLTTYGVSAAVSCLDCRGYEKINIVSMSDCSLEENHIRRFHHQDVWRLSLLPERCWEWKDPVGLYHKDTGGSRNWLSMIKVTLLHSP